MFKVYSDTHDHFISIILCKVKIEKKIIDFQHRMTQNIHHHSKSNEGERRKKLVCQYKTKTQQKLFQTLLFHV